MKKSLAVLAVLSLVVMGYHGMAKVSQERGDSGGPLVAGNGCVEQDETGCDNTTGKQMTVAIVSVDGDVDADEASPCEVA